MTNIHLPEHLVAGVYADGVRASIPGPHAVLDFIVRDDRSDAPAEFLVVDRVRLDVTSVQQLLAVLSGLLTASEEQQRRPPQV